MPGEGLWDAAAVSLVVGWVAFTLSESALFAPARASLAGWNAWLGKLANCGYCLSFWVAACLVAVCQPRAFHRWLPLDYVLTTLFVAWLAAFQWALLCWLMQQTKK
jgi:hypothetical protein